MISAKENYLIALIEHGTPEWVPTGSDCARAGGLKETFENGPLGGGADDFGVIWSVGEAAGTAGVPKAGHIVLDDICDWEDKVVFPNLDNYDWEEQAKIQVGNVNRDEKLIEYGCWNGQFLRISHLMGFENALCAMIAEEDAYKALIHRITDYKIELAERVAKYFKPDVLTTYIDVATERGLFMSPELYRELISPEQKRLNDAIKSFGMYPVVHNCGKCDEIIPDFIKEGYVAWSSAQPMNDIANILKTYGKDICVIGGYDSNGKPGTEEATDFEVEQEVRRCIEEYAPYGSYIFAGLRMMSATMNRDQALAPILKAYNQYKNIYSKA